jgi:hypothetical protein
MKEMSWYLLGVVTQSLQGGSPAQRSIFHSAVDCPWAMLEFCMYAQYKSHNNATLSYMEDSLCHSHTFNDIFLLGQAGNKAKAKANALRMDLMKKRKVDKETNAESWTPSKKQCEINTWCHYVSQEMDIS